MMGHCGWRYCDSIFQLLNTSFIDFSFLRLLAISCYWNTISCNQFENDNYLPTVTSRCIMLSTIIWKVLSFFVFFCFSVSSPLHCTVSKFSYIVCMCMCTCASVSVCVFVYIIFFLWNLQIYSIRRQPCPLSTVWVYTYALVRILQMSIKIAPIFFSITSCKWLEKALDAVSICDPAFP